MAIKRFMVTVVIVFAMVTGAFAEDKKPQSRLPCMPIEAMILMLKERAGEGLLLTMLDRSGIVLYLFFNSSKGTYTLVGSYDSTYSCILTYGVDIRISKGV